MAEGTRLKSMEDQIRRQDLKIQEFMDKMQLKLEENNKESSAKMDNLISGMESKLTMMMKMLNKEKTPVLNQEETTPTNRAPLLPTPTSKNREELESRRWNYSVYPKVELHVFEGEHPWNWIRKCEKFFLIHQVQEHQRMEVAEMYLEGKVDNWYQGLKLSKGKVEWSEFVELLYKRFDDRGGWDGSCGGV